MKKISYILTVLTGAGTVLLAGCNRTAVPGSLQGDEKFLNFSVTVEGAASVEEGNATKAEKKTSISTFNVTAWNNDGSDHDSFISGYREFSLTGEIATTGIRWTKPYNKVFYAYANVPVSSATVTGDFSGQTLEYTVPADAADQNDILMGTYSGNGGDTRTASLVFKHALTAVEFYISESAPISKVLDITLSGVYGSGSITQNADGTLGDWTTYSTTDVTQSISDEELDPDVLLGCPFMLIPQEENGGIEVFMSVELSSGSLRLISGTLPTTNWQQGKINKYHLGVNGVTILTLGYEIEDWGEVSGGGVYVD